MNTRHAYFDAGCDDQSNQLLKENLARIKGCFASLVKKVSSKLNVMDIDMRAFCPFIANLYPPGNFLSNVDSVAEVFNALTHNQLWDHFSYL